MYTGEHACPLVRDAGDTGPIGIRSSRLVRRVDGITEGYSVMGSYVRMGPQAFQQSPRLVHLKVLCNVFAYIRKHLDMGRLAYDSKVTDVN